jgi:hypothetical protein
MMIEGTYGCTIDALTSIDAPVMDVGGHLRSSGIVVIWTPIAQMPVATAERRKGLRTIRLTKSRMN